MNYCSSNNSHLRTTEGLIQHEMIIIFKLLLCSSHICRPSFPVTSHISSHQYCILGPKNAINEMDFQNWQQ